MITFPSHRLTLQHITPFAMVAIVLLIASLLLVTSVDAQPALYGERTLAGLLGRINAVAIDPENSIGDRGLFDIVLSVPTSTGDYWLRIYGSIAPNSVTYRITRLDAVSFCVTPNTDEQAPASPQEECFDFAEIVSIVFSSAAEANLREMPLPGEQASPQIAGLSGLAARYHQLNDPLDTNPMAYTGYFMQFREPFFPNNPDTLGIFLGVHYRGTSGGGINRVDAISYQQDYICLQVLRSVGGAGMVQIYCIPHTNIASIRLLRNRDVGQDIVTVHGANNVEVEVATLDVSEFLAAQQGRAEPVADSEIREPLNATQNTSDVSADVLTWWESGQGSLELMLRVPIDDQGTSLIVAHDATISSAAYVVTEVGAGYLCMASADVTPTPTIGDLCTTFDNIAQVVR